MKVPAKYTEVLKNLMDSEQVKPLLDKALSTYPLYKPENSPNFTVIPTREEINTKLLNHYKYREIGFETVGRFLDELEIAMNEIMPYYNQLLKADDIMNGVDDVFGNVNITETYEEETKGKSGSESSVEASSENKSNVKTNDKGVTSSTPQGQLDITSKEIDKVNYADSVNWSEDVTESDGTASDKSESKASGTTEGTTTHTLNRKGNQGVNTYAHDLKELREVFLNVVKMIITDKRISDLFMKIY